MTVVVQRHHDLSEVNDKPTSAPELPNLADLGDDLLVTTRGQRWWALLRPVFGLVLMSLAVAAGHWWITPVLMFFIFVAVVTVTHDVVHNSIGLTARQTDWALFYLGAILLESGHAYQSTHLQHHRKFPHHDDPEGDPARMTFLGAVVHGVVFLPRLWYWAWKKNKEVFGRRLWLLAEATWAIGFVVVAVWLRDSQPGLLLYALLAIVGSWVYPLLTVHLPHRNYGETPLTQTHTLRGWLLPKLFLELTYHLEHHLYPQVPSHNLAKLSRRLDPFFQQAGVVPRRVL